MLRGIILISGILCTLFLLVSEKKIEKTVKSNQQEPPKCGSTKGGVRAFYHMITRLSSTLSRNKTLVINFFFFKVLICLAHYPNI